MYGINNATIQTRTGAPLPDSYIIRRRLTHRQQSVLDLLCKGLRNKEIGGQLELSERTVKNYISQLLLIFDVTNRTELVSVTLQH
jgi:DNA-binding NarL/FixJ family response regulator